MAAGDIKNYPPNKTLLMEEGVSPVPHLAAREEHTTGILRVHFIGVVKVQLDGAETGYGADWTLFVPSHI